MSKCQRGSYPRLYTCCHAGFNVRARLRRKTPYYCNT